MLYRVSLDKDDIKFCTVAADKLADKVRVVFNLFVLKWC